MIRQKIRRNLSESKRVSSLKSSYLNSTKPEEALFERFQTAYQDLLFRMTRMSDFNKGEQEVVLQSVLDSWAFWLDEANAKYGIFKTWLHE